MNLRDTILAAKDLASDVMEVPEWGVTIEVKGMSGKTRAKFIELMYKNGIAGEEDQAKLGAAMVPFFPEFVLDGARDPATGYRVFEAADMEALVQKNGQVIERIALKVIELSGLNSEGKDKDGKPISAVDAAAKN